MRYAVPVVVLLACVGAGPATKPVARDAVPQSQATARALALVDESSAAVSDASAEVLKNLAESNADYRQACDERDTAKKTLDAIRKTDDSASKVKASNKYNTARLKAEKMESVALAADLKTRNAKKILADAKSQLERSEADDLERFKQKIVSRGMTRTDVEKMWGKPAQTSTRSDGVVVCHWDQYQMLDESPGDPGDVRGVEVNPGAFAVPPARQQKTRVRTLDVRFRDGVVEDFDDWKIDPNQR